MASVARSSTFRRFVSRRSLSAIPLSIFAAVALCLALVACNGPLSPAPAAPIPGGEEAAFHLEPTPVVLSVVYRDDFRDQASGWDDSFDPQSMRQYGADKYRLEIRSPNMSAWGLANRNISDFVLEVTARQEDGPADSSYGLVFRYQDKQNFYRFDITGDGFFLLSKYVGGRWLTLVDWRASPAIRPAGQDNFLRVSCLGENLAVFVNGSLLANIQDDSFRQGDIGFFAGSYQKPGVQASFDDLVIWAPPGAQITRRGQPGSGGMSETAFSSGRPEPSPSPNAAPSAGIHAAPESTSTH